VTVTANLPYNENVFRPSMHRRFTGHRAQAPPPPPPTAELDDAFSDFDDDF
jgi:hypothetical protein